VLSADQLCLASDAAIARAIQTPYMDFALLLMEHKPGTVVKADTDTKEVRPLGLDTHG